MSDKEKMRWNKSIEKGDARKSVNVEEVENGFIITIDISTNSKETGYKYECKKYISETNPLEGLEPAKKDLSKGIKDILSSFIESEGELNV